MSLGLFEGRNSPASLESPRKKSRLQLRVLLTQGLMKDGFTCKDKDGMKDRIAMVRTKCI